MTRSCDNDRVMMAASENSGKVSCIPYHMDGSLLHFMQGMLAALGGVKDYSMKQYLLFADKLQKKAEVQGWPVSFILVVW